MSVIILFHKWIARALAVCLKSLVDLPTISKILSSNSTKTLWPNCIAASSKNSQVGAYFIGLTIPG